MLGGGSPGTKTPFGPCARGAAAGGGPAPGATANATALGKNNIPLDPTSNCSVVFRARSPGPVANCARLNGLPPIASFFPRTTPSEDNSYELVGNPPVPTSSLTFPA